MQSDQNPFEDPYSDTTLYGGDSEGHIVLTARAFAALVGVTEQEMQKHIDAHGHRVENLPDDWQRAGARRCAEQSAVTGEMDLHSAIVYYLREEQR
ncbi:hypothetical protein ACTXMW_03355 [Brachybacterium paraconglomeratum]|uniref:hypothetical protein n=1 Tax=Brachybacterium paraconglomeratum TaxID=173362 RepID=UPI003FD6AE9C